MKFSVPKGLWQRFRRGMPVLSFVVAWLILAGLWELGAHTETLNPRILPPPSVVIPYLLQGPGSAGIGPQQVSYGEAIGRTLMRVMAGLGLGVGAAIPLGMLIEGIPILRRFVLPMIQTLAPIAPVAWVPVGIALMGTGDQSAIFVVFMGVFSILTLATVSALSSLPPELLKAAKSLGIRGWKLRLWVMLPATAASLMTSVRLNFFAAWMAVLAGEMAGINSGLGALIILGQQQFNMRLVMVGIMTIGVIGFLVDRVMLALQRQVIWWERRERGGSHG
jgi:NitT/TauT family transport system permease protein